MATARNLTELGKMMQKKVTQAIQQTDHVINEVVETGKKHVQKDVYDVYPNPKMYERTGQLKEDWDAENIDGGIAVFNTRRDEDTGKYIPTVIESGEGYSYSGYGYEYEQPRPFVEESIKDLRNSDRLKDALKKGLKEIGVDSV